MNVHEQQILASMVLLCVFFMFAVFAAQSPNFNEGLRRRSEAVPKTADEVAVEYARLAAATPSLKPIDAEPAETAKPPEPATQEEKSVADMREQVANQEEQATQENAENKGEAATTNRIENINEAQESNITLKPPSQDEIWATDAFNRLHRDMCGVVWANADPLPYENCDPNAPVNSIALFGGLTNALKLILLGGVKSWEENRCFFVDESKSHLNPPDKDGVRHGFLHKYMEPIGLPLNHPYVVNARKERRVVERNWGEFWNEMEARRAYGKVFNLPSLGFNEIEGHSLKRNLIRRMWRPHQKYRKFSCSAMENTHGLKPGEYIAFSVRRGDKSEEKFAFTELTEYISEAENQLHRFESIVGIGQAPNIFVATDDCSVMSEFRTMRPDWTFVSECDVEDNKAAAQNGFALSDFKDWGADAEDAHFTKFFTEIYAMTMSRVFIGVAYTNVSWWVYFLRPFRHSFILLDKPKGEPDSRVFNFW